PLLLVLLWREVVLSPQVTLEGLELLTVFEADDVVIMYRLIDRYGWPDLNDGLFLFLLYRCLINRFGLSQGRLLDFDRLSCRNTREGPHHVLDEVRKFGGTSRIPRDEGRDYRSSSILIIEELRKIGG